MIFEDPSQRRWKIVLAFFTTVALGCILLLSLSLATFFTNPQLPPASLSMHVPMTLSSSSTALLASSDRVSQTQAVVVTKPIISLPSPSLETTSLDTLKRSEGALRTAFLLQEDTNSVNAFTAHADHLDVVFPDWFFTSKTDCAVDERIDAHITDTITRAGVSIFARLTDGEGDTSYASTFMSILDNPSIRSCVAARIATDAQSHGARGVLADIEGLDAAHATAYHAFLLDLKQQLDAKQLRLIVSIPSGNAAYDASSLAAISDAALVIIHGEHYARSSAGPLASQPWFDMTLARFQTLIPKEKLLVGLGSYGMDWTLAADGSTTGTGRGLTYAGTMSLAARADVRPTLLPTSTNMGFTYVDDQDDTHLVWFLDATTAWNEWLRINDTHILGVALWRLGAEDPNIWTFLGYSLPSAIALNALPPLAGFSTAYTPEVYRVTSAPTAGRLAFTQRPDGFITAASYDVLPTGYTRERIGGIPTQRTVTLAISGALDPVWTPRILDLLTRAQAHATFFVYGRDAALAPSLLKEIAQRGFTLGSLGYTPQTLTSESFDQLRQDANTTQRLIEHASGRNSTLFAVPTPYLATDVPALQTLQQMGYSLVTPHILVTPHVIASASFPQSVSNQLSATNHIVALQLTNGAATFSALQTLLPALTEQGYSIQPLTQSLNIPEAHIYPVPTWTEGILAAAATVLTGVRQGLGSVIAWLFLITLAFSILRVLFMSVFVILRARHKRKKCYHHPERIEVSVLIPAYNEAATIEKTLRSLQQSLHARFEALVINDGSTDSTSDIVRAIADKDPRIRLIEKENGGKASALNLGMRKATHALVVTIDADTILLPNAIDELIRPFADPRVDAVCGNVEVGNTHNILTGFQTLEYITAQNFDRLAFEELNAINVVPGATGAWRRKRVLAIGGYESDTLTEDADLTIRMLAHGGKIVCAPDARSLTEAPDAVRDLAKQRFRWSFGTFQCLGKHMDLFFNGTVGWIALPNIFVFQILFPLLAPVGDLVLLIALFRGQFVMVFWSYVFFTLMDLTGSIFAFILEKKPKRLMIFALIQRFFYRQFLYVIILRAILAMLRGQRYGWNKLQRTGTVTMAGTGVPS